MGLPNFKMLGIEKEMGQIFDSEDKSDLQLLIDSGYFQNPLIANRPDDGDYCEVEVIECQSDTWWYRDLIGFRFFCLIRYNDYGYGKFIKEFKGVKLTNNKMILFRDFSPKDVIIV